MICLILGIYQHEAFYDIADEMGLLVWEELKYACSMYPVDSTFLNSVKNEITYQVGCLIWLKVFPSY